MCKVGGCTNMSFNGRGICRGCYNAMRGTEELNRYPGKTTLRRKNSNSCLVEDCHRVGSRGRGLCQAHYENLEIRHSYPNRVKEERVLFESIKKYNGECWNKYCNNPIKPDSSRRGLCSRCMRLVNVKSPKPVTLIMTKLDRFQIYFASCIQDASGCILWSGSCDEDGYGRFSYNNVNIKAHRASLELKLGRPMKSGMVAMHFICDNPPCVNPEHLQEGTIKENTYDMIAKGRASWQKGGDAL